MVLVGDDDDAFGKSAFPDFFEGEGEVFLGGGFVFQDEAVVGDAAGGEVVEHALRFADALVFPLAAGEDCLCACVLAEVAVGCVKATFQCFAGLAVADLAAEAIELKCPFEDELWILPDGSVEHCPNPERCFGDEKKDSARCEHCPMKH